MTPVTNEMIKEIAEQLDCGFRAYIHKTTGQLLFLPDFDNNIYAAEDEWQEELDQLENNFHDFNEIDKWSSRESFEMMTDFAMELTENRNLQNRLLDSLEKKKPFSQFKFIIDNSGDYRQLWFDFKANWQQAFVSRQLDTIKRISNDNYGSS